MSNLIALNSAICILILGRKILMINPILLTGGRRVLVHRLNPAAPLVMMDLRNGSFMQNYPDIQVDSEVSGKLKMASATVSGDKCRL